MRIHNIFYAYKTMGWNTEAPPEVYGVGYLVATVIMQIIGIDQAWGQISSQSEQDKTSVSGGAEKHTYNVHEVFKQPIGGEYCKSIQI